MWERGDGVGIVLLGVSSDWTAWGSVFVRVFLEFVLCCWDLWICVLREKRFGNVRDCLFSSAFFLFSSSFFTGLIWWFCCAGCFRFSLFSFLLPRPGLFVSSSLVEHLHACISCISAHAHFIPPFVIFPPPCYVCLLWVRSDNFVVGDLWWGAEHNCLSSSSFISYLLFFVDVDLFGWNLITHVPGGPRKDLAILFYLFLLCGEETKRI
jgi:hypothetical protein